MNQLCRAAALLAGAAVAVPTFAAEPRDLGHDNAEVGFQVTWLGLFKARGGFADYAGSFLFDPGEWSRSRVEFVARTDSVDVGDPHLNAQLRSPDYFDARRFSTLHFRSTALERTGPDTGRLYGDMTLRGVTRPVTLSFELRRSGDRERAEVLAVTSFKRSDFGMDHAVPLVSDRVQVELRVEDVPLR